MKPKTISKKTWDYLNTLSKKELENLLEIMSMGNSQDLDKDELILILDSEKDGDVIRGLSELKKAP